MKRVKFPLSDLMISAQAKKYVNQVLNSNRLSYGPFTKKFETLFANISQRKHAIITNSGTSGLQVALHALKEIYQWNDDDEVLVPAITFIASSNVILHNNLKPVFVDVEPDYFCIDPQKIEEKITSKTRAIMPVHLFGQSAEMTEIMKIAKKHNLKVIEDSCETMFVNYKGKPVGSLGDVSVFSTYIAHIITTGVGGIVTTNDQLLATTIKSLNFHGRDNIYLNIDDDDTKSRIKLNSLIERRFQFIHVGYSYRLTEMESALGVAELERRKQITKQRQHIGKLLLNRLSEFSNYLQLPPIRKSAEHIFMLFPIVIKNPEIERDDLLLYLEENDVETRLFMPLLNQPIYKKIFGDIENKFPVAKNLVDRGFIIGCHPYIKYNQINYLVKLLRNYFTRININTKYMLKWEKEIKKYSQKELVRLLAEKDTKIEKLTKNDKELLGK